MQHIVDIISSLSKVSPPNREHTRLNSFQPVPFLGMSGYCDGGNACLITTPWYAVHFIRAAFCILNGSSFKGVQKWEFFVLAKKEEKGCSVTLFGAPSFFVVPAAIDASCFDAGNVVRDYFEHALCLFIQNPLSFLVKDGLFHHKVSSPFPVIGFAKTSRQIEMSLAHQEGIWFLKQSPDFVVRLHQHAYTTHYVQLQGDPLILFPYLAFLSRDIVFPGYPYGLLVADRFARVSNEENGYLLGLFEALAGKIWKQIHVGIHLLNAHDVLDSIS